MRFRTLALATAAALTACEGYPTSSVTMDADGIPTAAAARSPLGVGQGPPTPRVVDFESPGPGAGAGPAPELVDDSTGITFTVAGPPTYDDWVLGIVANGRTSACVPGDLGNSTLGTGRGSLVGYSGVPIRASFPKPLLRGSMVSVRFQGGVGTPFRVTLLDTDGSPAEVVEATLTEGVGTCGLPGVDRGYLTVRAQAPTRVAGAIFEQLSNSVFVIDDLVIDARRGAGVR